MNFNINGERWRIHFIPPFSSILRNNDGKYTYGVTIPEYKTIYIANDISGNFLRHVIAHEVAHSEFSARGLDVPVWIEEILADIVADNILDAQYQTNAICRLYGKC